MDVDGLGRQEKKRGEESYGLSSILSFYWIINETWKSKLSVEILSGVADRKVEGKTQWVPSVHYL